MKKSIFSLFALFGLLNVVKEICLWKDRGNSNHTKDRKSQIDFIPWSNI